jgi:hypothetical protein
MFSARLPMVPLRAEFDDLTTTNSSLVPMDTKLIGVPWEADSLTRGRIAGLMLRCTGPSPIGTKSVPITCRQNCSRQPS